MYQIAMQALDYQCSQHNRPSRKRESTIEFRPYVHSYWIYGRGGVQVIDYKRNAEAQL